MRAPQVIVILILIMSGVVHYIKRGKERGPYNFDDSLINTGIWVLLLWWGGFWG